MKKFIRTLFIATLSLFIVSQIAIAEEQSPAQSTVGVRQLMNSADQFPDDIVVQGIVSKVYPQDNLIGLIDNPMGKDCCNKTGYSQCPGSTAKKCTGDSKKACPKAACGAAAAKCPMADGKADNNTSVNGSSKDCPAKAANESNKKCPMAGASSTGRDSAEKCPMNTDNKCSKDCPMAAAKNCPKAASKDCPKECPNASAKECTKPCPDAGHSLTLPVQWKGDMPEPADEVSVAGKISRQDGRLLFVAESLKVMNN